MSIERAAYRGQPGWVLWIPVKKDPSKKWGFFAFISEGEMMGHPYRHTVIVRVNRKKSGEPGLFSKPLTEKEKLRKKKYENLYVPIEYLAEFKEMLDKVHRDYFGQMNEPEIKQERAKVDEKTKDDEMSRLLKKYERVLR